MFLLDTNVVSELMRPARSGAVLRWLSQRHRSTLFVPVVVIAEITFGIARLPADRRRSELEARFTDLRRRALGSNIVGFDEPAALRCGELRAKAQSLGRTPPLADAQIAAIASVLGMTVATRDLSTFAPFGVPLVDPFDPRASP